MELLQGYLAHTTNSASKLAPKYTASRHATTSSATPTHFSTTDSTPSVVLASSSSCVVAYRIASYKAVLLLRIPNLGRSTFIWDVPRRVVQAEGEPPLRRRTLPSQTSDKRREWLGCVLDLSKVTFDFD
jgi:hypothetical protein